MKKRILMFLTLLTLLFISSCGIPNMFVPDESSVSFITDESNKKAKIVINSPYLKAEENNLSYSPELNLFYIIRGTNGSSIYSSLLSAFNSSYCNYPYCNPITGSKVDGSPLIEYKSGDTTYGLYQFFGDDSVITNNYFIDGCFNLGFDFSADEGFILSIFDNYGNLLEQRDLKRSYDQKPFSLLSDINDDEELRGEYVEPVEVVVYATVTFAFTEYTNIWNTKISKELFSFTLN